MPHGLAPEHRSAWDYLKHPFNVLHDALPELQRDPGDRDPEVLESTYRALLRRGRYAMRVRVGIVVLLYFSLVAGAVTGIASAYGLTQVERAVNLVLTFSTAATVFLLLALFLVNRYLQNVQTHVIVVGMELSSTMASHEGTASPADQ